MSRAIGYLAGCLDNLYFNWKNRLHPRRSLLFEDGWGSSACIETVSERLLHPGAHTRLMFTGRNPGRNLADIMFAMAISSRLASRSICRLSPLASISE